MTGTLCHHHLQPVPGGLHLFLESAESNVPRLLGDLHPHRDGRYPDRRQCHRGSVAGSADHNLFSAQQADVHQYARFPAPSHRCRELFVGNSGARSAAIPWNPVGNLWEKPAVGLGDEGVAPEEGSEPGACVAMSLSVMVMGTGAASFTDQDEFSDNYAEAAKS